MSGSAAKRTPQPAKKSKPVSWETFQKKYLAREDGYKYEWLNGIVEKTPYTMDKSQLFILRNLLAWFRKLLNEGKVNGELIPEADLFFLKNHRRPDVCWLTGEQIDRLAENGYEVPAFVIEIISNNDIMNKVARKMQDYRAAGVQAVWHILPALEEIHVYSGEKLEKMVVCTGKKECSAAPALPGFVLPAEEAFLKGSSEKK
ncbi:MAG: Uma2 family endonuclease [Phaeodactylibacter sp.]|nr:Uma2 family endonuclease [Phaeodactylibacter sp.]